MNLKFVCASLEHPEYSNVIWLRHSCRHTYPQICQFSTTLTKQHIEPPNSYRHSTPTSNYLSFSSPTVWLPYPQSAGRCAGPLHAFKCSGLNKNLSNLTLINKSVGEPRLPASSKIIVPLNKERSVLMGFDLHYTFAPFLTQNFLNEFVDKKRMKNH